MPVVLCVVQIQVPCYLTPTSIKLRAIQKTIREARESAVVPLPSLSDFSSSNEEMVDMEHITLGNYGRHDALMENTTLTKSPKGSNQ